MFSELNENHNFGALLHEVPQEDLLVLQVKSHKEGQAQSPNHTDFIIHPRHDIRQAMKDQRQQNKSILKNLIYHCETLVKIFTYSDPMNTIFKQLTICFIQCLQLIDNEKLQKNTLVSFPPKFACKVFK